MIGSGDLDRKVTIQSATFAQDAQGEMIPTWATYCTRSAKMKTDASGTGEKYAAEAKTEILGVDWTLRMDSVTELITSEMRLVYESDKYDIDSVQELTSERRRGFIILHTKKRGAIDV